MRTRNILFLLVLCLVVSVSRAQDAALERVRRLAHDSSKLEPELRHLTDVIGGRVTGTEAFHKAAAWTAETLRDAGADAVRSEEWTMATTWSEGETRVRVLAPTAFEVRARSIAWSPPLKGFAGRVVDVGRGTPEEFAKAGNVAGAALLVHSTVLKTWDDLFAEYLEAPAIIQRAVQAKAAAIVWTATRDYDILYRHINAPRDRFDAIPSALLAREDAERIARLIASGSNVQISIEMPNRLGPPVKVWNIVGEIKGSDLANESVLLGAHLDSWELGTGALDNGCNVVLTIEALRAIKAAGIRPRRTLRFVLFSGEEQGLLGSREYVRAHPEQLDALSAVVIFDSGTGKTTGYSLGGRHDALETVNDITKPFADWGVTAQTEDAFWGTDNVDFLLEGVPTLVANQVEANYLPNYHAYSDTFDKVDMPQLRRNLALAAYTVAYLGNAARKLAPRQTRAEIEKLLRDTKLDEQLKTFGLWEEWVKRPSGRTPR